MPIIDSLNLVNVISEDADKLTAMAQHVLSGYFFIGKQKYMVTGTIPILNTLSDTTLLAEEKHLVKAGYNPQEYYVISEGLSSQTQATATVNDILAGTTAWVNGVKITGKMTNNGAINRILNAGESYTIPKGYHDGNGVISSTALGSQTEATATEEDIVDGQTAWVNGVKITGNIPVIASSNIKLNAGESCTIPKGYHDGNGIVEATDLASQTQATATEEDIADGQTAWVNGVKITGSVVKIAAQEIILPLNGTYNIPAGIHNGRGSVTQNIDTQDALTITPAFQDQTISVKNKYMIGDILVTGINALNYNDFDSSSENIIDTEITVDYSSATNNRLEIDLGKLGVDNWHDQSTNNVYHLKLVDESANDILSGSLFINNLNDNGLTDTSTLYCSLNGESYRVTLSMEEGTNAHMFKLIITWDTTAPTITTFHAYIKECIGLRRYGDEHDTNN